MANLVFACRTATLAAALLGAAMLAGCGKDEPEALGSPGPPFLYVLEGPARVFVFGTIHLPDPRIRELPASVWSAHAASDVVLGELDAESMNSVKAATKQFLPKGRRLGDVVPPEVLARLRAYMTARGGSSAGLERLKPVWAAVNLGLLDVLPLLAQHPPMDQTLQVKAKQAEKQYGGLETVDEQLEVFNGLSFEVQAKFLDRTLADLEKARDTGSSPMDALILPYYRGDLGALHGEVARMQQDGDADVKAFMRRLLEDRNHVMAERLLARIAAEPGKTWFVAVGAGHLSGPEGLLALLEARGYSSRRATREETFAAQAQPQPASAR